MVGVSSTTNNLLCLTCQMIETPARGSFHPEMIHPHTVSSRSLPLHQSTRTPHLQPSLLRGSDPGCIFGTLGSGTMAPGSHDTTSLLGDCCNLRAFVKRLGLLGGSSVVVHGHRGWHVAHSGCLRNSTPPFLNSPVLSLSLLEYQLLHLQEKVVGT